MKRVILMALIGWAGIVWLAYHLAELRIPICHFEQACLMRATATRDATLVYGLSFGLVGALVLGLLAASRGQQADHDVRTTTSMDRPYRHLLQRTLPPLAARTWLRGVAMAVVMFAFGWVSARAAGDWWSRSGKASLEIVGHELTPVEGDPFAAQGSDTADEVDETDQPN